MSWYLCGCSDLGQHRTNSSPLGRSCSRNKPHEVATFSLEETRHSYVGSKCQQTTPPTAHELVQMQVLPPLSIPPRGKWENRKDQAPMTVRACVSFPSSCYPLCLTNRERGIIQRFLSALQRVKCAHRLTVQNIPRPEAFASASGDLSLADCQRAGRSQISDSLFCEGSVPLRSSLRCCHSSFL